MFNEGLQTKVAPHLAPVSTGVTCLNVDLDKGSLTPYADWVVDERTATGIHTTYFQDAVVSSSDVSDVRSYAKFGSRLYWSNGSFSAYGLMRYDGTNAGVNAVAPIVSAYGSLTLTPTGTNGAMNETYAYVYTVVDVDGIESIPSTITTAAPVNQDVSITIGADTVSETVASRRIYRTGGSNPTFNLIAELAAPTLTYVDDTRDLDVSRIELSTFTNHAPPPDLTNLIENNGTMWGSVGDRVYFSRVGQPEFWGNLDFLVLNDTCTGLGSFMDTVVAFTKTDAYLITGYHRDNIAISKLPYNEGCLKHETIVNVTELLVWTSVNGICIYNGSEITVATRNILSWSGTTGGDSVVGSSTFDSFDTSFDADIGYKMEYAVGIGRKYYGVHQDGIGVLDLNNGVVSSTIALEDVRSLYFNSTDNALIGITSDLISYQFNKGTANMTSEWKTAKLNNDNYSRLKQYRRVYFDIAPLWVRVYVNDLEVLFVENQKEFFLPAGSIGNTIQFHIATNLEIKSLKYEYGLLDA